MGDSFVSAKPFISVIITAFNRKEFLEDAIDSVISQTLDKDQFEIKVITNFDNTELENKEKFHGITFLRIDEQGIGKMILKAVNISRGEIISFLDDDDLFFHDKLQVVYNLFKTHKDIVYFRHNFKEFFNDSNFVESDFFHQNTLNIQIYKMKVKSKSDIAKAVRLGAPLNMSTISISKNILINYSNAWCMLTTAPDFMAFFSAVCDEGKYLSISEEVLSFYRIHNSMTRSLLNKYSDYQKHLERHTRSTIDAFKLFRNIFLKKNNCMIILTCLLQHGKYNCP